MLHFLYNHFFIDVQLAFFVLMHDSAAVFAAIVVAFIAVWAEIEGIIGVQSSVQMTFSQRAECFYAVSAESTRVPPLFAQDIAAVDASSYFFHFQILHI